MWRYALIDSSADASGPAMPRVLATVQNPLLPGLRPRVADV
jgi:hypothetical protein